MCLKEAVTIRLAEADSNEMLAAMVEEEECFYLGEERIRVTLTRFVKGPFVSKSRGAVSVWEVEDRENQKAFIVLVDEGGPHAAVRLQSL